MDPRPTKLWFNISTRAQDRHHSTGLSYRQPVLTRAPSTADKFSYVFHAFSLTLSDTFRASQRTMKSASPISSLGKQNTPRAGLRAAHRYVPEHRTTSKHRLLTGARGDTAPPRRRTQEEAQPRPLGAESPSSAARTRRPLPLTSSARPRRTVPARTALTGERRAAARSR